MIKIKSSSISIISLNDLKNLSIGSFHHGRIGVIPYYVEDNVKNYIINKSNKGLFSDFGGGISKNEHPYFDGLKRELDEECPVWSKYILEKIETNDILLEQSVDISSNNNSTALQILYREFNNQITKYILILLEVDKCMINSFKKSKEVKELHILKSFELYKLVNFCQKINNGLMQLKLACKGRLIRI